LAFAGMTEKEKGLDSGHAFGRQACAGMTEKEKSRAGFRPAPE